MGLELTKQDRVIIYGVILIPLIVFLGVILYNTFINPGSGRAYYLEAKANVSCHGVIIDIFHQRHNRGVQTLKMNSGDILELPSKWEDRFQIGDSVSKNFGSLFVEHYRKGDLKEVLSYNDISMK